MRPPERLSVLLALLAGSGCADVPVDSPSPTSTVSWMVELPEIVLSSNPVLAVGGESHYLPSPGSAAVSGDSVLVVFDQALLEIASFRLDGTGGARWGGRGRGPGEFQSVHGAVGPGQDVWVWDPGQLRVSRFDLGGSLVEDFPLWSRAQTTGQLLGPGGECLWFSRRDLDTPRVERDGYGREGVSARCVGESSASLPYLAAGREHVDRRGSPGPVRVPFGRDIELTASGGNLWATPTDSLFLESFSPEAIATTLTMLPALAESIPREVLRDIAGNLRLSLEEHVPDWPRETYPDVEGLWGDPDGGGWAQMRGWFVRLDSEGHPVEKLRAPSLRVLAMGPDHVVTVRPDDVWQAPLVEVWSIQIQLEPGVG